MVIAGPTSAGPLRCRGGTKPHVALRTPQTPTKPKPIHTHVALRLHAPQIPTNQTKNPKNSLPHRISPTSCFAPSCALRTPQTHKKPKPSKKSTSRFVRYKRDKKNQTKNQKRLMCADGAVLTFFAAGFLYFRAFFFHPFCSQRVQFFWLICGGFWTW